MIESFECLIYKKKFSDYIVCNLPPQRLHPAYSNLNVDDSNYYANLLLPKTDIVSYYYEKILLFLTYFIILIISNWYPMLSFFLVFFLVSLYYMYMINRLYKDSKYISAKLLKYIYSEGLDQMSLVP